MIEIKQIKDNGFGFSLKAENGGNLLNSVPFANKDEIKRTVRRLTNIDDTRNIFERKTNHEGKFLFNVKDENGKLIGHSELYTSEAGMENGIKNVINRISHISNSGNL
ncbi:YegP family protein [Maribacter halichondriae]|uniref:YegP family protein n=1 Tax=Maribacter halichondriae TaxID=2980554 RepID=UPI00235A06AC|nr:YegP family protein [Maribacter sp. Hal144]